MDKYDFMHCPSILCNYKLTPPWDNYIIGTREENGEEVVLYKCPYCSFEFTANNTMVNSVKVDYVSGFKYVVLQKQPVYKVVGVFYREDFIEVDKQTYLHIPRDKLLGSRMFSVPECVPDNRLLQYIRKGLRQQVIDRNMKEIEVSNEKAYSQ